jgi:hypothetical protein
MDTFVGGLLLCASQKSNMSFSLLIACPGSWTSYVFCPRSPRHSESEKARKEMEGGGSPTGRNEWKLSYFYVLASKIM